MERKMISIERLVKVMTPKEMKNVLGGSGGGGDQGCGPYPVALCLCEDGIFTMGCCAYSTCDECMRQSTCAGTCEPADCYDP